ncbi:hypothetical protein [Umezawaea beigongshangensis]|uniref:hypothetical protein n=1 Tax=Umezawaea beigongshangensis TaxID=2780383 RepID=UPI0018F1C597|nr:hypothetical protein [Umezawaea beigongshangensis]
MNADVTETQHGPLLPVQRRGGHEEPPRAARLTAVERYKEILATAAEAHDRMRGHDAERTRELIGRLIESQERMARVLQEEKVVRLGVELHWEKVTEALWEERWMRGKPRPAPDTAVPRRPLHEHVSAMDAAYQTLEDSLQKRTLLRRKP